MKFKFGAVQLIPLAASCMGILFAYMGLFQMGFWHRTRGPMAGFYPSIIGIALAVIGVIGLVQSFRDAPPVMELRNWLVPLSVVFIIAFSYLIGVLPSLIAYVLVWLRLVQKNSWRTVAIVIAAMSAIVYGVFIYWLQVPFESGMLFKALSS